MGAGRLRLIRQLLTESLVLALAGGIAGLLLAYVGVDLLARAASTTAVPRVDEVGIDGTVLGFTALLALATGVIFDLAPALETGGSQSHQRTDGAGARLEQQSRIEPMLGDSQ